jgi:thioredoxin-like negative regulator of GroEL
MRMFGPLLRCFTIVLALFVATTAALARQPYNETAFQKAQASGKIVLVDVYASWCPVCRKQQPILQSLEKQTPGLVVYVVDFDKAKDVVRKFNAQSQSTLIVFKGGKEIGRSVGVSDPDSIKALVAKGL